MRQILTLRHKNNIPPYKHPYTTHIYTLKIMSMYTHSYYINGATMHALLNQLQQT